jgi:hypothetical protein
MVYHVVATEREIDTWHVAVRELDGFEAILSGTERLVPEARRQIAEEIGCQPDEFEISTTMYLAVDVRPNRSVQ